MTSTFSRANCLAIVSFSRPPRRVPAACSPSLSVVSNTATFSDITLHSFPRGSSSWNLGPF